jgi:hypothetical protein
MALRTVAYECAAAANYSQSAKCYIGVLIWRADTHYNDSEQKCNHMCTLSPTVVSPVYCVCVWARSCEAVELRWYVPELLLSVK